MLGLASCPIIEGMRLDLADQSNRLGALPQASVPVLLRPADPPALPGQAVGLPNHENRKLGLPARLRLVVDIAQDRAQLAHLGPREMMAEQPEHFRIADRLAGPRR